MKKLFITICSFGLLLASEPNSSTSTEKKNYLHHVKALESSLISRIDEKANLKNETFNQNRIYSYVDPLEKSYVYVESGWLYWRILAQVPYANVLTIQRFQPDVLRFSNNNREQFNHFNLQSGYKMKLGIDLPYEGWSFYGQYLRITSSTQDTVTIGVTRELGLDNDVHLINPYWVTTMVINSAFKWDFASSKQQIKYRIFEGMLSKAFYPTEHFALTPMIGIQGTWIKNQLDITYAGIVIPQSNNIFDVQDVNRLQNSFYGWGVKGRLHANWILGYGFEILGKTALGIIPGHLFFRQRENFLDISRSPFTPVRGSVSRETKWEKVLTNIELSTGMNWGYRFYKDKIYFGVQFAYELNIWPHLIRLNRYSYATFPENVGPGNYDPPIFATFINTLTLHGITLCGKLEF